MGRVVKMNFDELRTIVKKFRDEEEDIVQLHIRLRDKVRDLHKDWEGEGSERFFKEMENEVLPAISRLAKAIFHVQDVLQKITKLIRDFDEDTKGFFNVDFILINQEPLGGLGSATANSWERMNQLGVWDANRKGFVYPDNQLQPELPGDAAGEPGGHSGSSGSAGRLVVANEFTGEVSMVDVTALLDEGAVTPPSSDEKKSNDEKGLLPEVTTVEVDR